MDEHLSFEPTGAGEHLLVRVEKRNLNTITVARALAEAAGLAEQDVSYAGLKDRHAVTRQWFSLRGAPDSVMLPGNLEARILERCRHQRKLRRGQLASNRFQLTLRSLTGPRDALEQRLTTLATAGFPNYFGVQRFGHDGANVDAAWAWLRRRPRERLSSYRRGLYLSVARAHLFNAVLAERVRAGAWQTCLEGEVLDQGAATGPLWGRGRNPASGDCAQLEETVLAGYQQWLGPLEHVGLNQQRRRLCSRPIELTWRTDGDALELEFGLVGGSYATVLLGEIGCFDDSRVLEAALG